MPTPCSRCEPDVLTAIYARRDEPQELIDGLRENLRWVDQVIEVQTPRSGPWPHEGQLNAHKRELLAAAGAGWVLFIDPDERIEDREAELIPPLLAQASRRTIFMFPFREMWTPTQWRCDGAWGVKGARKRLFHLHHGQRFPNKPIHCQPIPIVSRMSRALLPTFMYHLKMIEPDNRRERARAYLDADPAGRWLRGGDWSHMHDESGVELAEIEPERAFTPPYRAGSYRFLAPERG
jgi:hypothetical protein